MSPRIVAAAVVAAAISCVARPACADSGTATSLELVKPIGDVYNERTTDGDAYPQTIAARLAVEDGAFRISATYWRNAYLTESGAAGQLTRYTRIEGGYGYVAPFLARDSSFEGRLEVRIPLPQYYVGIGVLQTWTNYNYPNLNGVGIGVERAAETTAGVRLFGSAFVYPSISGTYVAETPPFPTLHPSFTAVRLDYGAVLRAPRFPLSLVLGYQNEFRSGHALPADVRFIRSDPYLALRLDR